MNYRTVDGNLVEDAKVLTDKQGKEYLAFRIANNDIERGQKVVTYFNVVSYNDYAVQVHKTEKKYSKGRYAVIVGKPKENMTQKGDKMYLNRDVLAYNVQLGGVSKSENNEQTTYRDVAPAPVSPTCEAPRVAQPQVATPTVSVTPQVETPVQATVQTPVYAVETPVAAPQVNANTIPNIEDDLPF